MKLTPEREAELNHQREFIRNGWRISTECGNPPSEAEKAFDMVRLEMGFLQPDLMLAITVANYASDWLRTGNPYNLDFAKLLCQRAGINPPPYLAELDARVSEQRIEGSLRGGTAAQIKKENARNFAFNLMSCLGAAGATRAESASKAARALAQSGASHKFKASTLEHEYPDNWKRLELDRKAYFLEPGNEGLLKTWQHLRTILPDADEELKGNRRD